MLAQICGEELREGRGAYMKDLAILLQSCGVHKK